MPPDAGLREPRELLIGHDRVFLRLSDSHDGRTTRSRAGELWSVHAHLSLPYLRADSLVSLTAAALERSLPTFFADLAQHWSGWEGVKEWRAYEGGLALFGATDRLGHVTMTVELRERSNDGWLVRGDVPLDAGRLEALARDVDRFVTGR